MGTSFVPDSWIVGGNGVVWGVDLDINTVLTSKSGDAVIEFFPTTPPDDPGLLYRNYIPVETGDPYVVSAVVQADSIAAGNYVAVAVGWYNASQALISVSYAWNAPLPSTGAWHNLEGEFDAPASARYARPLFFKANNAFTAYLDTLVMDNGRIKSSATLSTTHVIGAGIYTIHFDLENYDFGGNYNTGTYKFTVPSLGVYSPASLISASVNPMPANGYWLAEFYVSGGGLPAANYTFSSSTKGTSVSIAGLDTWVVSGTFPLALQAGQTIETRINNQTGKLLTVAVTSLFTVTRG